MRLDTSYQRMRMAGQTGVPIRGNVNPPGLGMYGVHGCSQNVQHENGAVSRRSAGGRLLLLLRPSRYGRLERSVGRRIARRGRNDSGSSGARFRQKGGGRVSQSPDEVGWRNRRGLQRLVVIEHPAGQHRFGGLRYPLVDQSGDFPTQICRMIEARELKTLQGGARGGLQIIERRSETRNGHGQCSHLLCMAGF
jgi:hypothetical protein